MRNLTMYIENRRRDASVTLTPYYMEKYSIAEPQQLVKMLGVFQSTDADWSGPVCVCELPDGHLVELVPDLVQSLDGATLDS